MGQWAGAVRIVRRGRRSPERVWTLGSVTLIVLPLESLPTALTVKGAGGRRQQGRTPLLVLTLAGWLLFRLAAQQLGDPPSSPSLGAMAGPGRRRRRGAKTDDGAAKWCGHGPGGRSSSGRRRGPGHDAAGGAEEAGFLRVHAQPQASQVFPQNGQGLLQRLGVIGEQGQIIHLAQAGPDAG